jgi:hypothetical protein
MNVETKLRLTEIMKDILASVDFEDMYCDDYDSEGHCAEIMTSRLVRDIACGASKAVLFLDGEDDYVIKIPFYGYGTRDEDEDYVTWFNGASLCGVDTEPEWNYCELESVVYDLALETGVEEFFASTEFLCHVNDIPVYVSEKMDNITDGYDYSNETEEEEAWRRAVDFVKEHKGASFSTTQIEALIRGYGEEKVERLVDFISNLGVSDFHNGNWGYDKDSRIRLLDYSGYSS